MPRLRRFAIEIAVMAAVGFALAAIGPFGSFGTGSFPSRLAFWLPAMLGAYAIVGPFMVGAHAAARLLALPLPFTLAVAVLISSAPMTLFVMWLSGHPFTSLPDAQEWFQLYLQIALISGGVTLLFWLLEPHVTAAPNATGPAAPVASTVFQTQEPPPFLTRLPPHLRKGLLALEMEDHYVRAHASGGSALVLLRMRDAVAEMTGSDGMQVHRSWWVARSAVERIAQDGRNVRLLLKGGIEVPVARSYLAAVRAAGWLAGANKTIAERSGSRPATD